MSLITSIRDYVDVANSTEQLDGYTLSSLTFHTITFLLTAVRQALVYCFTLNWLRDFSYFCLTPPLLVSSFTNVNGIGDQPLSHLLAFPDSNYSTGIGLIIVGLSNGFFTCMHLSAAHLVTIQRLLVQGVPAGACSALGTAVGQFSFLVCVIFGFRGLLFPWLALEPLHFLVGTAILLSVASTMAQDRRTVTVQWSNKGSLFFYSLTSFLLAWCEQTAIFQWMGNLSFGAEPTFLESALSFGTTNSVLGNVQFLTQNIGYLFAFFFGSVLGAFLIGLFLQRFLEFLFRQKGIAVYYGLIKQANLPLATLVFAFGFGSLPYYGFDYLITKGFGFVPHEPVFQQTFFSPTNLVSKTSQTKESSQGRLEDQLALLFTLEGERNKSFAVDTTPFDNGQYLKANQKRPQAFEDLNYRGEHLWTNRLSRISNIREQANQTQSSFLGPVFSWMRSFLWGDGATTNEKALTPKGSQRGVDIYLKDSNEINVSYPERAASFDSFDSEGLNEVQEPTKLFRELPDSALQVKNKKRRKELSSESEQIDNYVKEFDKQFDKGFSNFYETDPHSLIEVEDQWQEKRIKDKCYTNPIYKFLLNTEIDSFLARQPNSYLLSPQEEILLLKKRQLLSNYYDTLSFTNQVSKSKALEQLVPKSYANVIYNHQFKGTLKVARRLFSVKRGGPLIDSTGNEKIDATLLYPEELWGTETERKSRTIKFDQPLFSKGKANVKQTVFHEELDFDRRYQNSNFTEEVVTEASQLGKGENIFSLEQAEISPLYAGWDEQLRKFTITNRFQSRALAGYTFSGSTTSSKTSEQGSPKNIIFTSWPIPNPLSIKNLPPSQDNFFDDNDSLETKNLLSKSMNHTNAERNSTFATKSSYGEGPNEIQGATKVARVHALGTQESYSESNDQMNLVGQTKIEKAPEDTVQKGIMGSTVKDGKARGQNKGLKKNIAEKAFREIDSINKFLPFQLEEKQISKNHFLFQTKSGKSAATNDMVNALLQWQKLIKENKQLSKEDKQAAKEIISHWPENIHRAYWSNELIDNELELDEPTENLSKKQAFLWEFTPPYHGGFVWSGNNWKN